MHYRPRPHTQSHGPPGTVPFPTVPRFQPLMLNFRPSLGQLPTLGLTGLLLALVVSGTGCRLTKVDPDLTPLTDNLAERLRSQVHTVVNRTGGEELEPELDAVADDKPTTDQLANGPIIQGAGFSRSPLATDPPSDDLMGVPGRLALPDLGNVPDMARRLIAPLPPLWTGGVPPNPATQSLVDSALNQLIDTAHAQVNELGPGTTPEQNQSYVRNQVSLRLLSLIGDRPQDALEPIPGIDNTQKEFLQKLLWAQVNYFDTTTMPEPGQRATTTIEQLDDAIRSLQPRADLKLRHLALCRQIQTFGDYEPFEKNAFSPGQGVLLYVEVENFTSRPTDDGRHETLLKSMITIREVSGDGQIVHEIPVGVTPDICRTTRRDYFHNYEFKFPRTLALGQYVLRLTVTDLHGNKMASESLKFVLR